MVREGPKKSDLGTNWCEFGIQRAMWSERGPSPEQGLRTNHQLVKVDLLRIPDHPKKHLFVG